MKAILLLGIIILISSCSTSQTPTKAVKLSTAEISTSASTNMPALENLTKPDLIDNLTSAPELVHYSEDGAMEASVLNLRQIDPDGTTIAPVKEVGGIVALREKAIPLLIEHLDDTRPSSATFHGGYLPDGSPEVKVPVGYVCLDILLHLVDNSFYLDKKCRIESRLEGCVKDGFYFRPDDYWILGESDSNDFVERPIVRIVKANWQNAHREGRLKYGFKVTWK